MLWTRDLQLWLRITTHRRALNIVVSLPWARRLYTLGPYSRGGLTEFITQELKPP